MAVRALTIKRIPDPLYRQLKRSAQAHRRSLNSEAIECLERSLRSGRPDPVEFLASADALRSRLALDPLTEQSLRRAKAMGRP